MEKLVEKQRGILHKKVHELMKEIDKLNEEEDKTFPDEEKHPKEVTPEELEDFAKRLSDKLNHKPEADK